MPVQRHSGSLGSLHRASAEAGLASFAEAVPAATGMTDQATCQHELPAVPAELAAAVVAAAAKPAAESCPLHQRGLGLGQGLAQEVREQALQPQEQLAALPATTTPCISLGAAL